MQQTKGFGVTQEHEAVDPNNICHKCCVTFDESNLNSHLGCTILECGHKIHVDCLDDIIYSSTGGINCINQDCGKVVSDDFILTLKGQDEFNAIFNQR